MLWISLDGVRFDYLGRQELPGLDRVARSGTRAEALTPVFPSSTFPNHVSLATGTHPDRHGMVANTFLDPERGEFRYGSDASWIEAEPIWVAAERQGVPAATFFWVGSETDWNGTGARHRRAPFDSEIPESEKVDQLLAWLDLPAPERPRLLMSWWHGADGAGHRYGPDAEETRAQLAAQDRELVRLLAALDERGAWEHTTLLLTSDHGMVEMDGSIDPSDALDEVGIEARMVSGGPFAMFHLRDPARASEAAARLDALEGVRAWPRDAVPERLRVRHRRIGHVLALADPPLRLGATLSVRSAQFQALRLLGNRPGGHGYDPALPEMGGILLAMGRAVPAGGRLPRLHAIDVAATVAGWLGIAPPEHSEGRPIPGLAPPRATAGETADSLP